MRLTAAFPEMKQRDSGTERETKMKNIVTKIMTSAVLLLSIGSLEAQGPKMQATVPFAWQLNGAQLSAGEYVVSKDPNTRAILIHNAKSGKSVVTLSAMTERSDSTYRLVFHRVGNRSFLSEVHALGGVDKLPVSKAEKRAVETEQGGEMAIVVVDVRPVVN